MVIHIAKKLFINLFPQSLILAGSIMLGFSLKLVSTEDLWEAQGYVGGGVEIGGMALSMPQQNDTLFWWGFWLFIAGSALELFKLVYNVVRNEMDVLREVSIELNEEKENTSENVVPQKVSVEKKVEQVPKGDK